VKSKKYQVNLIEKVHCGYHADWRPCEKCLERLLRIIRPHPLGEYFVLELNGLLHLFA